MSVTNLYTEIDFTPQWYRTAQARRRIAARQGLVVLLFAAAVAGFVNRTWQERDSFAAYHKSLEVEIASTQRQVTEVAKLQKLRQDLTRKLQIHRELHQPITYSQITGTLASIMPEAVAMRSIEIRNDESTTTVNVPAREGDAASGKTSSRGSRTVTRPIIALDVEGVAPSDVEIANFIGAAAGHGLFDGVKMVFSRQAVRGDIVVREFRISMEVPLDCRFEPAKAGEVAGAE
jgi:Tfp pilus assembly protein PilN